MAEFQGLGFDPVPGSADAVAEAARSCSAAAAKLGDAPTPGEIPEWAGPSAQALADRAGRTRAGLAAVPGALREAAAVLDGWAGVLAAHRRQAEDLDNQAVTARRKLVDAQDDVERAQTTVQFSPGTEAELTAAHDNLAAVQRELDQILDQARDLERAHTTEATRVAERLRALGDGAPLLATPDFRSLATHLDTFSRAGRDLGVIVARTPVTPPSGAVGAFTAALGGR
ncbi:hypothetical protein VA596_27355 [Amycolatopsis sp., V23-08]|uniref:Uncharacterized protein n=1 Tax=Amycolatopsis heterodermiae TaxID=3110235 RepID=A0ABU5RAI4_9PSEU|nr:hypothetical protein [Amycolatopsis sp., V23-08]MEA5363278.1 hypothetical protein [Amycolatopsis sp., V23-08]